VDDNFDSDEEEKDLSRRKDSDFVANDIEQRNKLKSKNKVKPKKVKAPRNKKPSRSQVKKMKVFEAFKEGKPTKLPEIVTNPDGSTTCSMLGCDDATVNSWRDAQLKDPSAKRMIEILEGKEIETSNIEKSKMINYQMKDGLLCRVRRAGDKLTFMRYVPRSMVKSILREMHDSLAAGHQGVFRTAMAVRSRFWWPSMIANVVEYVQTCDLCQRRKMSTHLPPGPLQRPVFPARKFEHWHLDACGPFPGCLWSLPRNSERS